MTVETIQLLAEQHGLPLAGDIITNPSVDHGYLVPIYLARSSSGRQVPSGKTLADVKSNAAEAGYVVEFLLIDETAQRMEEALRASLISSFPDYVRNSYLSILEGVAHVWIDKKKDISDHDIDAINQFSQKYASLFKIRGAKVHLTSEIDLATQTEILRIVRRIAPANCEDVDGALRAQGFSVPSLQWINHRFDALRKAGLLVRMPNRRYGLTLLALRRLGTTKNRRSPDIGRLLALARKGG